MRQVSNNQTPPPSQTMRGLWPTYSIIFASEFIMGMFAPMLTLIFFDHSSSLFHTSSTLSDRSFWYGITIMLTQICAVFANLTLSALSDVIGRKKGLLITFTGFVFQATACLIALISGHMLFFIVAIAIAYLTYASRPIATAAIIDNTSIDKRFLYIGLIQLFTGTGYILGPFLSGHIANFSILSTPFSTPYLVALAVAVLFTFLILFLYKEKSPLKARHHKYTKQDILTLLKNHKILILTLLLMLNQLAWGTYFIFIPVIGKSVFGFSPSDIGMVFSLIGISLVCSSIIIIPIMQRLFSYKNIYLIGAIFFIAGIFLSLLSSSFPGHPLSKTFFWISLFPTVAGDVIIFTMLTVLFSQSAPANFQGLINGIIYTVAAGVTWGVAGIIGGLLTGLQANASLYISVFASITMLVASLTYARHFFKRSF